MYDDIATYEVSVCAWRNWRSAVVGVLAVVIFWKEISSKSKIWYPVKLFDIWIPQTAICQKMAAKLLRYVSAKHEIAYWKHVLHSNRKEMKNENPGIL